MSLFYKIYGSRFNFPFPTPSLCPPLPTFLLLTTKHRLCKWKASTSNLSVLYMSFWAISTTYVPQPYRQVCMASEIHGYTSVHPLSSLRSPVWVSQHLPSYYCLPAPVFPQMSTQVDFSALLNVFLSLYKFCAFSLMLCFYFLTLTQSSSIQLLSRVRLFATPWIAAHQASLSITNPQSSLKLTSIESVMPSSHLILCCQLLPLPLIPPRIRVFSNESTLRMRWPKNWSFSVSIIPSKEHPGLISFRMDWLDLLAVQGTLKSLLQHHSTKASILRHSAFFTVQLSHPYMTTGKTIALMRRTSKCNFFPYLLPNRTENIRIKCKTLFWDKPQTGILGSFLDALLPLEFQKSSSFRSNFRVNLINIS